jgi:EAL domain-containing protein (putative c-di-GMP-specific phosphodiesterase class I)/ActR/RegA family two-component response regulator
VNAAELILLIEDDPAIAEGLGLLLERGGRTTILCADVESADLVLARYPVTHVISDVQFSGPFGFEGLHFIKTVRRRRSSCRIVLMSGEATEPLRSAAMERGAAALLAKPFSADELERALGSPPEGGGSYELLRVPQIESILQEGLLTTAFQPIVWLNDAQRLDNTQAQLFGFEALIRTRRAWPAGGTEELFEYALRRDRLADLNLAALRCALGDGSRLPSAAALFINLDPVAFEIGDLAAAVRTSASRARVSPSRIVLAITERSRFDGDARAFDELRADGIRFALDDHASAVSHLTRFDVIRPSFIKIGGAFATDLELDGTRTKIVRHIVALAHDLGCSVVLEGVESAATARAAMALGIDLAQGCQFGRPEAASRWIGVIAA